MRDREVSAEKQVRHPGWSNGDTCRKGLHPWPESRVWRSGNWRCLPCARAYDREYSYTREKPEPTKERREQAAAASRESRKRYPEKSRARNAVARAIRRGELVRPDSCAECGKRGPVEAAHDDYSRQLDVTWLCRRCHAKKDRGLHVIQ